MPAYVSLSSMPDHPHKTDPIDYIQRTRDQYAGLGYPPYSWVENKTSPAFTKLHKPLSQCKVGLVCSGGIYQVGQIAFHFQDDFSYREISTDAAVADLRATHFAYDLTDAHIDPNVVFPLHTLKTLVAAGEVGQLNQNAYTFMGGIYSARKVIDILAPAIADRLQADEVDVALMVPV